ncbi:PAS domain S-box protein [Sulfurospirillum sp. T05]|uniref:histidine kinase n=1 Tax=Sulfurospirillum tamanense TaxID=2813362 RepID=A0ABS2WNL7_9BACT|nr:ATP-binding protein [Sulfurospirillum tamanensis]MBN2963229.1 PAS domain S-box protein [Sulfurospirillum tamanensis]
MKLEKYQEAIETSNIVSKTNIEGIITFVNDEFCRICGYSKKELIGANHNIVRHPDVPKETFKKLWETILAKKVYKSTVKNRAKNGTTFYVNTTVIPMVNTQGVIEEFIAIRYDVTDTVVLTEALKRKEEELEQLNSTLEERVQSQTMQLKDLNRNLERRVSEEVAKNREKERLLFTQARLASMGEMIGNIAHQWRQPLSELGIDLYKLKKLFGQGDQNAFLETYEHGKGVIKKMSQTIEDFRNFFNPNKPREDFYINEVVDDALAMLKGTLGSEQIVVRVTSEDKVLIHGFKSELIQVLINLITNAKDAFLESSCEQKYIDIHIARFDGRTLMVSVRDNAGGINEEILEKIFEPYFTTKQGSLGTGLGLYMSKMIVENSMKGSIEALNAGEGACFNVKVPIRLEK